MVCHFVRGCGFVFSLCFPLAFALAIAGGVAHAQTIKEEVRLLDKPSGAHQGAPLSAGTGVKVAERQGFWVRVESGGRSGWMKASGLTFSSGSGGSTAIDTGRLGTGNIVSTSAARGLSAKDLLNGAPRMEEVAKMALYVADGAALQSFIAQGRVVALSQSVALKPVEPPPVRPDPAAPGSNRTINSEPPKDGLKRGTDGW